MKRQTLPVQVDLRFIRQAIQHLADCFIRNMTLAIAR
jgi:hypothetical protein